MPASRKDYLHSCEMGGEKGLELAECKECGLAIVLFHAPMTPLY